MRRPIALTIAGSDSGGGAGIQADLKTFAALGVHGTTAITAVTAQNPSSVRHVHPCPPHVVLAQIEAVFDQLPPAAIKTGLLFSKPIIETIAQFLQKQPPSPLPPSPTQSDKSPRRAPTPPLIVDPVMVATSGVPLLRSSALKALTLSLLPLATLVTPNAPEAQILTGRALSNPEDLRWAAREIHRRFGCAALVKGGHLRGFTQAIDIFFDGQSELLLTAPFVRSLKTHGTGCTYSAAITAYLARGLSLSRAVTHAKQFITGVIQSSYCAAQHRVLGCSPRRQT